MIGINSHVLKFWKKLPIYKKFGQKIAKARKFNTPRFKQEASDSQMFPLLQKCQLSLHYHLYLGVFSNFAAQP